MTPEIGLLLLSRFTAVAVVLMFAGAGFSMVLERLEEPVARLVARHGPIRAFRIVARTRRYSSGVSRFVAAVKVGTRVIGFVVASILFAVPAAMLLVVLLLRDLITPSTIPLDVGYLLMLGGLAYLVGPIGLYWVLVRLGKEPPRSGSWPPPIPRIAGATRPSTHWDVSVRLYGYHLHGILVHLALWGSLLSLLNTLEAMPDAIDNGSIASLGYSLLVTLLAVVEALLFTAVYWRFDRRTRAIGMIATFLDGPQSSRLERISAVFGADPLGRSSRPSQRRAIQTRDQLVNVVRAIETCIPVLQKRQRLDVKHPAVHALQLEAAHLRGYLAEPRSLDDAVPDDVRQSLQRASATLVGGTAEFVQATIAELERYEEQAVAPKSMPSWMPRITGALDLSGKATGLMLTLLALIVAVYLWATGQATPGELLENLGGP